MLQRLFLMVLLAVSPALAQQASVTGTLTPYANGAVSEPATGNSAPISGQGFFRIPITSTPNHSFTITPISGSYFIPFSVSVNVSPSGSTDISQQLLAAMPIPNPFVVASLLVQTSSVNIAGLSYSWPTAHAVGCLHNDGAGGLSWASSCGGGGGGITAVSVATANGVSGSSSGGSTPALTIVLGDITPSSIAVNNTAKPTQLDFTPTSHATATVSGAASIGVDTVATPGVYLLPQAPASGFYYGTNAAGKVSHTYVNGFSGTCGPTQTLTVVNGLVTGCT